MVDTKNLMSLDPKQVCIDRIKKHLKHPDIEVIVKYLTLQRDAKYKQLLNFTTSDNYDLTLVGELRTYQKLIELIGEQYVSPKLQDS